jgi:A/G-specific adenine glycosylase
MTTGLESLMTAWYAANARDLPWRRPGAGAWSILVSEFMLQQTPVSRVLPAHQAWLTRWPTPTALAAATPADALRQWDRLGYPRRAIRLHASARLITQRHNGAVPATLPALRELPGVGAYTSAAVASFAFGQRHPVLDTNVRRVLARLISGQFQPGSAVSVAETALAESLLPPADDRRAATWSVALMELGALVCTASRPSCQVCPVAAVCAWRRGGSPADTGPRRKQAYAGTDRHCRGTLLAELRAAVGPVPIDALGANWPDRLQRERVLGALLADGLAVSHGTTASLPGESPLDCQ